MYKSIINYKYSIASLQSATEIGADNLLKTEKGFVFFETVCVCVCVCVCFVRTSGPGYKSNHGWTLCLWTSSTECRAQPGREQKQYKRCLKLCCYEDLMWVQYCMTSKCYGENCGQELWLCCTYVCVCVCVCVCVHIRTQIYTEWTDWSLLPVIGLWPQSTKRSLLSPWLCPSATGRE